MDHLHQKLEMLKKNLQEMEKVAVAFSAGVDSTFLLKVAHEVLKDRMVAFTLHLQAMPSHELCEAKVFCQKEGIRQIVLDVDVLTIPHFCENPSDRCYHCKKAMFTRLIEAAAGLGFAHVVEGSNVDDMQDYRPGMRAISELGIASPLKEAGLTKQEIRELSNEMGLPTWNKPSFACLASRFAYGQTITPEGHRMVEQAEAKLASYGFRQYRVRVHDQLARIELEEDQISRFMQPEIYQEVVPYFKSLGFLYVTLDLDGFHSGNMKDYV